MFLSYHSLRVNDWQAALEFYSHRLGLECTRKISVDNQFGTFNHAFLQFPYSGYQNQTQLELVYHDSFIPASKTQRTGYWKIGITLADVDLATSRLIDAGEAVSEPHQFRDIGYMCHLQDPAGNSIELLQHTFEANKPERLVENLYPLGGRPGFGQITIRVKDPAVSLAFYQTELGMTLLSRQTVEPYGFTLYFLAFTDETPPDDNIDAVENREWLWQRPYTVLELQHIHGSENNALTYDASPESGFESFSISNANLGEIQDQLSRANLIKVQDPAYDSLFESDSLLVQDPDGYAIRFLT